VSSLRAVALTALALLAAACREAASDPPDLRTPEERFSYSMGARLGGDLRKSGHAVDRDLLVRGLLDGLSGDVSLGDEELGKALREGVMRQSEAREAQRAEQARAALEDGQRFLAENAARPGVISLESGVQYEVLQEGTGPVPSVEDFVSCRYRGELLDGTVFDETGSAGRPSTFAVTSVVDGLEQAILRMPVGARWKIWVPSEHGYGPAGGGAKVPPNSVLVFELELVAIADAPVR
jgi:FKBP-type peptidyl-prolyl cis-trans isomerase FklB